MYGPSDLLNYQLDLLTSQFHDGFSAYENAITVLKYYKIHGYTEHFRELIGNENIIDAAGGALKKFYEWLKQKISELVQKIRQFFHNLKVRICRFLGIKVNDTPSPNDTKDLIQTTKNLSIIKDKVATDNCISNSFDRSIALPYGCSSSGSTFNIVWDMDAIREAVFDIYAIGLKSYEPYEESVKRLDYLKDLCNPESNKLYTCTAKKLKDNATVIYDIAMNAIAHCDTVSSKLAYFEHIVKQCDTSTSMSEEDRFGTVTRALQHVLVDGTGISKEYVLRNGADLFDAKACMERVAQYISLKSTLINVVLVLVVYLDRVYNASSKAIYLDYKIDTSFARDLQTYIADYYQMSSSVFNPRKLIVTNISPKTWIDKDVDIRGDSRFPVGWTGVNGGQSGAKDCYINYRACSSIFEKEPIDPRSRNIRRLMATIVHECTHLFDAQNGQEFTYPEDDIHDTRPQEKRATYVEMHFIANRQHMEWLCGIIRDVRRRVKR